jgi:hypothetical protein
MLQPIRQLTVFAFDVHISAGLLTDPGALTPAAQFLVRPKLRLGAQPPDLPHFRVSPLNNNVIMHEIAPKSGRGTDHLGSDSAGQPDMVNMERRARA